MLRPPAASEPVQRRRQHSREKYLTKLAKEQETFRRWMSRLKRACHALEKQERKIARLEKTLASLQ